MHLRLHSCIKRFSHVLSTFEANQRDGQFNIPNIRLEISVGSSLIKSIVPKVSVDLHDCRMEVDDTSSESLSNCGT